MNPEEIVDEPRQTPPAPPELVWEPITPETKVIQVATLNGQNQAVMSELAVKRLTAFEPGFVRKITGGINEALVKTFGLSTSAKYGIGYYTHETRQTHHIPRYDLPPKVYDDRSVTAVSSLIRSITSYTGMKCGLHFSEDYITVYSYMALSATSRVVESRIYRRTMTKKDSYYLWYNGDFVVVMRALSLLGLGMVTDWLEVPLTIEGKVVEKFKLTDIVHSLFSAIGTPSLINIRDTLVGQSAFFEALTQSPKFALDWAGLDTDLNNVLSHAVPNITQFQEFVTNLVRNNGAVFPAVTDAEDNPGLTLYMEENGYPGNIEKDISSRFTEVLMDNRVIDAVQDMEGKDSVFLNKCLRIIQEEDPEAHRRLLLTSNPATLNRNVEDYMAKRVKRQDASAKSKAGRTTQSAAEA